MRIGPFEDRARVREEIATRQNEHDPRRRNHEGHWMEEPHQAGDGVVKRPETQVRMPPDEAQQFRRPVRMVEAGSGMG